MLDRTFFNAKIKLDNTTWAGNIEIHKSSSQWKAHNLHNDPAYDNVILHVVFENDHNILRKDQSVIPVLELKGKFDNELLRNYQDLIAGEKWIACEGKLKTVDPFVINNWTDRLLVERMEEKSLAIKKDAGFKPK